MGSDADKLNATIARGTSLWERADKHNASMPYGMSLWERAKQDMKDAHDKRPLLSTDSITRKRAPIATGCLDYFPLALVEIGRLSMIGNDKHNPPDKPMHWSKHKSFDHADSLLRHLIDRGKVDIDGVPHSAKVAWRALAILQLELEAIRKAEQAASEGGQSAGTSAMPGT